MDLTGTRFEAISCSSSSARADGEAGNNPARRFRFTEVEPLDQPAPTPTPTPELGKVTLPRKEGLERLAIEARACAEVNYMGTVLALGCFVSPAPRAASSTQGA